MTLATLAVYARTFGYGYVVLDDMQYVYQNGVVRQGLSLAGLRWAFTAFWSANWHPLTWISLMMDCQFFGLYPGEQHAVNVFLHLASSLLLFAALLKMTGHRWRSALVAGVFALHPTHVESVAWISERKDVLSALFEMLTLVLYAAYVNRPTRARYAFVALAFAMALLSKPMAVTFPLVLLLLDYWPLGRMEWPPKVPVLGKLLLEKLPLLALSAPASVMTFLAQRDYGAVVPLARFTLATRFGNAAVSYVRYLGKAVWPANLAVLYPLKKPDSLAVAGSALLLVAITIVAIRSAKNKPYILIGWLWFLGTLVPVIGVIQVGVQSMADRYLYVPLVGLSIAVIWLIGDWVQSRPLARRAALSFAVGSLVASAAMAYGQVGYWKNSKGLFLHALAVTKNNFKIENDLGLALAVDGDSAGAIRFYEKALAISPNWPEALTNLGSVLLSARRFSDAVDPLQKAVHIQPQYAQAQAELGAAFGALGKFDEARQHLEAALDVQPHDAKSQSNLCYVLMRLGRLGEATARCNTALRLDPGYQDARVNLGRVLAAEGRKVEAGAQFSTVLASDPKNVAARSELRQLQ